MQAPGWLQLHVLEWLKARSCCWSRCNKITSGGRMMLLAWLGVSLGEFEFSPQHGSFQTPSKLSSSSPQPPSPGSSDCKPQVPQPMSFIHLHRQSCSFPPQQRKWRSIGGAQITQQLPTDPRFVSEHLFGDTVALL